MTMIAEMNLKGQVQEMSSKAKTNFLLGSIVLLVAIVILCYFYFKAVEVNKEYDAIIYSYDTDFEQKIKVQLSGQLYKGLFGKHELKGTLLVDEDLVYDFRLRSDGHHYFYHIVETMEDATLRTIGTITASQSLDHIWLMLNDINERYDIDGYVFGPAESKEEANKLIKSMLGWAE